jgi:hypothetical protein
VWRRSAREQGERRTLRLRIAVLQPHEGPRPDPEKERQRRLAIGSWGSSVPSLELLSCDGTGKWDGGCGGWAARGSLERTKALV